MAELAVFPTAVAATQTLTCDTIPANNDTVTIGTFVYTFKTTPSATTAKEVLIGATLATALTNLAAAINLTGTAGTTYGSATVKHTEVKATATATTLVVTALMPGSVGNLITTTETLTPAGDIWGAAVCAGGVGSAQVDLLAYFTDFGTYEQLNSHVLTRLARLVAAVPAT